MPLSPAPIYLQTASVGFSTLTGANPGGQVDVLLRGAFNRVTASGALVTVHDGLGQDTVTASASTEADIALGGYGNTITALGDDHGTISSGLGNALVNASFSSYFAIVAGGNNNTINEQGGRGTIDAGGGAETISVGGGSGTVTAMGSNDVINLGAGDYTTHTGPAATINSSTLGLATMVATGTNNVFNLTGPGIVAGDYDALYTGAGAAKVTINGGSATANLAGTNNAVSVDNGFAFINDGAGIGVFTLGNNAQMDFASMRSSDLFVIQASSTIKTAQDAVAHLQQFGGNFTMLVDGSSKLDFYGTTANQFTAANFKVIADTPRIA